MSVTQSGWSFTILLLTGIFKAYFSDESSIFFKSIDPGGGGSQSKQVKHQWPKGSVGRRHYWDVVVLTQFSASSFSGPYHSGSPVHNSPQSHTTTPLVGGTTGMLRC